MNTWRGKVLAGLPLGQVLIVGGQVKPNPNKISLELSKRSLTDLNSSTSSSLSSLDIDDLLYLQISIYFGARKQIRCIFRDGKGVDDQEEIVRNWKCESVNKQPLAPGAQFIVRIAVLQKCFEIYVNDHIYGSFEFVTTSSNCLQYVVVKGDFARITQFHHRLLFPLVFPKTLVCSEKIAFQSDVARKYETGTVIVMECIAKGPPNAQFSICFQCNETGRIVLRFQVDFGRMLVSRNYQRDDNSFHSEDEETDGEFLFQRGKLFKLAFGVGDEAFIVAVDGQYYTYYNYPSRPLATSSLRCYASEDSDLTIKRLEYHADSPLLPRVEKLSSL